MRARRKEERGLGIEAEGGVGGGLRVRKRRRRVMMKGDMAAVDMRRVKRTFGASLKRRTMRAIQMSWTFQSMATRARVRVMRWRR